ncbi:MAG: tetratricopeptide repeat protein [Deltaproteobacteria bacterium]
MTKHSQKQPGPDASPSSSETHRRVPLWQALTLPLVAILLFFLLIEGSLALFGVKPALETEDPFVGFASNVPLFVPAPGGEKLVTADNKLNYFNSQSFPREKAPTTYRIFCLGGSTTYGRPYNDATSFSGWLRRLLPKADGSKSWEVINAGGISYASYRVAHLMEELIRYQPDLFIIYTGHNEFLEERTYGKLRDVPPAVQTTVSLLARTRTWAAMTSAMKRLGFYPQVEDQKRTKLAGEVNAILDRSIGPKQYFRNDPLRANILEHYRVSLERMVALARSVGAKVIFVTPASNLKDCSPFKSQHTAGLDPAAQQRSEQMLTKAKEDISLKDWTGALDILDKAVALDPRYAELLYRRGRVLLNLGRFDEALSTLQRARDEDVCPLRALTPMRRIVSEVAHDQGAALVDFIGMLAQRMQSEHGYPIPGKEYFFDHVHPTIEGNKIMAVALVRSMIDQGLASPGPGWGDQAIAAVASQIEGSIDKKAHGQALANLARVLLWAGKNDDAARLARQACDTAGEYRQVAMDSASILTSVYQRQGKTGEALQLLYSAIEKAPGA